jgi:hypothetical protein
MEKNKRKRIGRLKTASDIARYMARCIRRVERGGEGGDSNENYKLVMMASVLVKTLEVSSLERRIQKLEEVIGGKS